MSPLEIEIMLHYNSRVVDYGEKDDNRHAPGVVQSLENFCGMGMLEKTNDLSVEYRITDKGLAYVKALTEMQTPVCVWQIPD